MLVTFSGRKSQRRYTTPVRYIRVGEAVRCFTSSENQWWRNLKGGADVVLRIEGEDKRYYARAIYDEPDKVREALMGYLSHFPQDAAYHDIGLTKNKQLDPQDLERASRNAVVVEARPL